ncbi:hypothetical protein ACFS5L_32220 [Streptomyces phyllanthi]|uniref:hypothetical protein n=1 Tax=Streptomyces phyllanthi TaxID=1803180 RepID=UPI00337145FF
MDQLAVANWMFATVNRDEDTEPAPYPEPVPRPGDGGGPASTTPGTPLGSSAADEKRSATPAEIVAFLNSPA